MKMLRLLSYCWILINVRSLQEQIFHSIYTPVDRSIYSRRKFWIRCSQRVSTSTNNTKFAAIDVLYHIVFFSGIHTFHSKFHKSGGLLYLDLEKGTLFRTLLGTFSEGVFAVHAEFPAVRIGPFLQ